MWPFQKYIWFIPSIKCAGATRGGRLRAKKKQNLNLAPHGSVLKLGPSPVFLYLWGETIVANCPSKYEPPHIECVGATRGERLRGEKKQNFNLLAQGSVLKLGPSPSFFTFKGRDHCGQLPFQI
jgi:hypothetical protein